MDSQNTILDYDFGFWIYELFPVPSPFPSKGCLILDYT